MKGTFRIFSRLFVIVFIIKIFDIFKNLVIASALGVSNDADIYTAMITIPDSLIVLLGLDTIKGVVNSEYAHFSTIGQREQMWKSFNNLINILFWISVVVVSAIILFNDFLIGLLLPGFEGIKKEKAADISYIIFPILFLKVFIGYFNSVYNANKKYFLPVIAPAIVGILLLVSILFPYYKGAVIYNLSFGNLAGNFLLLIVMLAGLTRIGAYVRFQKIEFDEVTLKVLKGSAAILLLVICNQLFLFSKNYFASYFGDGAVAALHYSGSITSAVISLIFSVFFTVLISDLSTSFSSGKVKEAANLFLKTTYVLLFGIIPVVVFFIIFSKEILSVVYLRGSFDEAGILMTLKPFFWDALSLISFILYIIPTALYLAKKEYSLLTKIGSAVYISGILINYLLSSYFGFYAISMATFITTGVYGLLLFFYSGRIIGNEKSHYFTFLFLMLSGILLYGVLYILKIYLFGNHFQKGFESLLILIVINLIIAAGIYYFITSLFKVNFADELIRRMKKKSVFSDESGNNNSDV
ncbi:MAG: putative lipid II flippase MurJ [Ignavibacteria bacterium]|nr:putative lipid II flippase MurJ [Ignavibacteria bacterium]